MASKPTKAQRIRSAENDAMIAYTVLRNDRLELTSRQREILVKDLEKALQELADLTFAGEAEVSVVA